MTRGSSTRNIALSYRNNSYQNDFETDNNFESGNSARYSALLLGAGIAALGLTRKSATRATMLATGGTIAAFALRDASSFGRQSQSAWAESSIVVSVSPEKAYSFWRDFQNMPRFMNHLKSVQVTDARHSRWTAYGPANKEIEWDAEITDEQENQRIAWRSIEGSDIEMEGSVEFTKATGDRGTLIKVEISYDSAAGAVGNIAAKLMGKDPSFLMRQDMRRFKALLETGEIPTVEGQSHGPRSMLSGLFKAVNPDEPVKKSAGRNIANINERRVS